MNTMLFGRSRCGRRAKYCAMLKRAMPVLLNNIRAIGVGGTDQELIVGFAEIGTWQNAPYRFGRHLPDLRVEMNSNRHRLSSDLTLDEGADVFSYPQGRNAPSGLTRIGSGLAARRRRGVGDGEGIILPLSIAVRDALPAEDHTEDPGLRRVSDVGRKDDRCDRHGRPKERFGVESAFVVSALHRVNARRERLRQHLY